MSPKAEVCPQFGLYVQSVQRDEGNSEQVEPLSTSIDQVESDSEPEDPMIDIYNDGGADDIGGDFMSDNPEPMMQARTYK